MAYSTVTAAPSADSDIRHIIENSSCDLGNRISAAIDLAKHPQNLFGETPQNMATLIRFLSDPNMPEDAQKTVRRYLSLSCTDEQINLAKQELGSGWDEVVNSEIKRISSANKRQSFSPQRRKEPQKLASNEPGIPAYLKRPDLADAGTGTATDYNAMTDGGGSLLDNLNLTSVMQKQLMLPFNPISFTTFNSLFVNVPYYNLDPQKGNVIIWGSPGLNAKFAKEGITDPSTDPRAGKIIQQELRDYPLQMLSECFIFKGVAAAEPNSIYAKPNEWTKQFCKNFLDNCSEFYKGIIDPVTHKITKQGILTQADVDALYAGDLVKFANNKGGGYDYLQKATVGVNSGSLHIKQDYTLKAVHLVIPFGMAEVSGSDGKEPLAGFFDAYFVPGVRKDVQIYGTSETGPEKPTNVPDESFCNIFVGAGAYFAPIKGWVQILSQARMGVDASWFTGGQMDISSRARAGYSPKEPILPFKDLKKGWARDWLKDYTLEYHASAGWYKNRDGVESLTVHYADNQTKDQYSTTPSPGGFIYDFGAGVQSKSYYPLADAIGLVFQFGGSWMTPAPGAPPTAMSRTAIVLMPWSDDISLSMQLGTNFHGVLDEHGNATVDLGVFGENYRGIKVGVDYELVKGLFNVPGKSEQLMLNLTVPWDQIKKIF